jgi:rhodanese-related sulfurtransferase
MGIKAKRSLLAGNHPRGDDPMFSTISRDALKAKLDAREPVVLVEALPERHFRDAHLPGAINLPHDEVDARAPSLLPDKDAQIVVYCASLPCQNSAVAARRLVQLGYTRVSEYAEGKKDWMDAGLPVESGSAAGVA